MSNKTVNLFKTCLFSFLLLCLTLHSRISCYNIEVIKVGKFKGEPESQFGYSVALVRSPNSGINQKFYPKHLLVGAPNLTYNGIIGYGQVSGCSDANKENLNCQWMNVTDISDICSKLKKTDTDCAQEGRLAATMAVNKQFESVRYMSSTIPMVTVCAPGWKNVYPEIDSSRYQNYMIGMCLKLDANLKPINCNIDPTAGRSYCWPFWAGSSTTTNQNGRPVFTYAQGGFSATFTQDGQSEVIGGPGSDDWRGAFIAHQKHWEKRLDDLQGKTIYFGYALATGKLDASLNDGIVSGVPNYYAHGGNYGHFGKFEIYKGVAKQAAVEFGVPQSCDGEFIKWGRINQTQTGTKFGASLATVDLNGDGFHEVVVGAPLYSDTYPEEGRVFVYTFKNGKICGPIGIFSGGAEHYSFAKTSAFARFGSVIASAGDLDKDGFNDVAIGAPYEENGHGVVYIYRGSSQIPLPDVFSQRISGRNIDAGIRSFGWSIYGDEDVDDNSFPDLAVGAYQSDMAMVFRSRPIVDVSVEMKISPNPIPLNASSLNCSLDREQLCFNVTVLFQYKSIGDRNGSVDHIVITWTMDSDTLYRQEKGRSRIEFRTNQQSSLKENITLLHNTPNAKTYVLDVKKYNGKPEPQDAWTKVRMEGSYVLVPLSGNDFARLDPILPKNATSLISENAEFDKKCDSLDQCTSDLALKVDMFLLKQDGTSDKVQNNTVLYVDAAKELEITIDVKNILNSSYRAIFRGEVTAVMRRDISSNNGVIGSSCKYDSQMTVVTNISCSADSKLDLNENFRVKAYFDITSQRLVPDMDITKMKPNISINVRAEQANKDVNELNNAFKSSINIALKYDIKITKDEETSDQVRYKADEKSDRMIRIIHRYYITNVGPSFIPMTYVNVTIPLKLPNAEIAIIKEHPSSCVLRGSQTGYTTTQLPTTTTDHGTIMPPEPERRRRELERTTPRTGEAINSENVRTGTETSAVKNITCESSSCEILECRIEKLRKSQIETIELVINLHEKELAKMKDIREIWYGTKAVVTDPVVWFGGKVVPFDQTKYAEKWTTLVLEPASVVSEINIWIIIGSVLGAVALLVVIVIILWRCGFFKRKKHNQVQEWKRASLYNRKSVRLSTHSKQPYNAMDEKDKEDSQ